jgi:hypothetical protein
MAIAPTGITFLLSKVKIYIFVTALPQFIYTMEFFGIINQSENIEDVGSI